VLGGSVAIAFAAIVTLDAAHAGPAGAKSTKGNAAVADAQGVKKQKPLPEVTPEGPLDAQFCQAVRDAATEARFAYQSEKLEGLAKEIDERLAKLNAKTAELKEWMAKRDDFKSRSSAQLVSIFAAMRPESASEQLTKIDPATAASILSKLEARAASAILNDMPSDKAAALASILAGSAQQDATSRQ
jgi:flagellar motility protein MotE (MotC chaperone)